MDNADFKGRKLNVEMSGSRPRKDEKSSRGTTTKLHVAGVGMDADSEEIRVLFQEFGNVSEVHLMSGRDVAFVHIDEKSAEHAMVGVNGTDFNGEKLKVEYGTLSRKPQYDKRAPKVSTVFIQFKIYISVQTFLYGELYIILNTILRAFVF